MSARTVAEVLGAAADLIEPEGAWTQGAYARDVDGEDVNPGEEYFASPSAVCWCLYGAIHHVVGFEGKPVWLRSQAHAYKMLPDTSWNDDTDRTQAEVVAKLREAAAKAREQGL